MTYAWYRDLTSEEASSLFGSTVTVTLSGDYPISFVVNDFAGSVQPGDSDVTLYDGGGFGMYASMSSPKSGDPTLGISVVFNAPDTSYLPTHVRLETESYERLDWPNMPYVFIGADEVGVFGALSAICGCLQGLCAYVEENVQQGGQLELPDVPDVSMYAQLSPGGIDIGEQELI